MRGDGLSPERGQLQFTPDLFRSVAYDTLTRREKRARHLATAAQLRDQLPYDGAEVADVVAAHYPTVLDLDPTPRRRHGALRGGGGYRRPATVCRPGGSRRRLVASARRHGALEGTTTTSTWSLLREDGLQAARWARTVDLLGEAAGARLEAKAATMIPTPSIAGWPTPPRFSRCGPDEAIKFGAYGPWNPGRGDAVGQGTADLVCARRASL